VAVNPFAARRGRVGGLRGDPLPAAPGVDAIAREGVVRTGKAGLRFHRHRDTRMIRHQGHDAKKCGALPAQSLRRLGSQIATLAAAVSALNAAGAICETARAHRKATPWVRSG
jgi:hypothetical protein